jgi:hypothetical protein
MKKNGLMRLDLDFTAYPPRRPPPAAPASVSTGKRSRWDNIHDSFLRLGSIASDARSWLLQLIG